jgi:hypothetical protein
MNIENTLRNVDTTFISKYKPYFINDFCIDDKLKSTLKTLLEIDNLNLLFIGNASSGKTSLLCALIREYYKLKKDDSLPENNILFINNLKEQGIQYFRNEMKTFCQSHSTLFGKKKLVIIDEPILRASIVESSPDINIVVSLSSVIATSNWKFSILLLRLPLKSTNDFSITAFDCSSSLLA